MFETQLNGPNRIDISISGKIDSSSMRDSLDALDNQSKGFVNGRMMYRIDNFDMPSFGAIAVELSRLPMLFDLLRRFDRVAVLTEKNGCKNSANWKAGSCPDCRSRLLMQTRKTWPNSG